MEINCKNLHPRDMINRLWRHFCSDSLFRNSVYLMLSTGIMAFFGFIFWVVTTHYYTSEQIGFATALISATILLSNLSLCGFNISLIRYLPQAKKPNMLINAAMATVIISTVIISALYLLKINYFAPKFYLLLDNPGYGLFFIIFMIFVSLNTLTDSIFIAYRASKYNFIVYFFFGLTKIILPFFFLQFGSYGIFFSYTGAVIIAFGLSIYFMAKKFNFHPSLDFNKNTAKQMIDYSLVNYFVSIISGLPTLIAPILIVNKLGASDSAYFYMASTIAALLYVIPQAVTQSLLAEGSYSEKDLIIFVKKAIKLIGLLLFPSIIIIFLFGKFILLVFGAEYSAKSYQLLQIMAILGIFLSINSISSALMRVRHQMKKILIVNICYVISTATLMFFLIQYGVVGISWALLGGQAFMSIIFFIIYPDNFKKVFF